MLRPRAGVISETVEGEVIAIDLETGVYYSLTGTAAVVWGVIEAGADQETTVDAMTRTFGDEAGAPVRSFVDELVAERLIEEVGGTGSPAGGVFSVPIASGAFCAPVIERFTDMAHLLWMDPVHEVDDEVGWPQSR